MCPESLYVCYNVFMLEIELCNQHKTRGHLRMMIKELVTKISGENLMTISYLYYHLLCKHSQKSFNRQK